MTKRTRNPQLNYKVYYHDDYDENYYRYKAEKDLITQKYPPVPECTREEYIKRYNEILDLIETSPDWREWVIENQPRSEEFDAVRLEIPPKEIRPYLKIGGYNPDGTPIPEVFDSIKDINVKYGFKPGQVSSVLMKYNKTARGYVFYYILDDMP
jgi:hypothetical protein